MAGHHNPGSPGHHSSASSSWQDPREREWQSPVSLGYEAVHTSGWRNIPTSTYQTPAAVAYHYSPPAVRRHIQAGPQTWAAAGHQDSPGSGYMAPTPAGYPYAQSPGQQSPREMAAQSPIQVEHRDVQPSNHQDAPPAQSMGQETPPVFVPPTEATASSQRTRFSLSYVIPRRTSEQSTPKESKPPPLRRETVSASSSQPTSTQATPTAKSVAADSVPYDIGKTSGWYRGLNYDTDEMWTNAVRRDCSAVSKCLKAGLNVNYCRWHKNDTTQPYSSFEDIGLKNFGQGARSLADVVAYKNDTKTMRLLMENGVDLGGNTSAAFVSSFRNQFTYKYSLEERKVIVKDAWTTPLHIACRLGHIDMIRLLLEEGRVDPSLRDAAQRTGLHMAVMGSKLNIAKLLLEKGSSIQLADSDGVTALAIAAAGGKLDMVKLFLENGAVVDTIDKAGTTSLYHAALVNRFDIVKILLCHGADIDTRDNDGMSALFRAASSLDVKSMEVLVDCGANIDSQDKNGCTALLRAAMAKNVLLMSHLLLLGADVDVSDNDGWTPLFIAMLHNDDTMIQLLLSSGPDLEKTDSYGNTALHQAALLGSTSVVRHMLAVRLERNTNAPQVNILGETPLIIAAKHNRSAVVKVLLKYGADPRYVDPNGYRAIDRAMYWGSYATINHLSQVGINVDSQAFLAVQQGKNDMPDSGNHDMIIARTPPQYSVSRKPMNTSSSPMRDIFARTVTWTALTARMREKQGKPAEDTKPVEKPSKPTVQDPGQGKSSIDPKQSSTTAAIEEEEEYVSPDPFEACIPKLPPSLIINNHLLNVKGGINKVEAGGVVASVALGIAGTVLGA